VDEIEGVWVDSAVQESELSEVRVWSQYTFIYLNRGQVWGTRTADRVHLVG